MGMNPNVFLCITHYFFSFEIFLKRFLLMMTQKLFCLSFILILNLLPKVFCSSTPYYPLIINKDTLGITQKLLDEQGGITSNKKKMVRENCVIRYKGSPVWKIEHDSLFLEKLGYLKRFDDSIHYSNTPSDDIYNFSDLKKNYKNFVNGRVFAKEINIDIVAERADEVGIDSFSVLYNQRLVFLKIRRGKVVEMIDFIGTTYWVSDIWDKIQFDGNPTNAQWKRQPQLPNGKGVKVDVALSVDDKGELIDAKITEGADKRWNKSVIKVVKRLIFWGGHIFYEIDNLKHKKDRIELWVSVPLK